MKKLFTLLLIGVTLTLGSCDKTEVGEPNQNTQDTTTVITTPVVDCNCGVVTRHITPVYTIPNTNDPNTVGGGYDPGTHLEYHLSIWVTNNCTDNEKIFNFNPSWYTSQNLIDGYYNNITDGGVYCSNSQW